MQVRRYFRIPEARHMLLASIATKTTAESNLYMVAMFSVLPDIHQKNYP